MGSVVQLFEVSVDHLSVESAGRLEESAVHLVELIVLPSQKLAHLKHSVVHRAGTQEILTSQPLIEEDSEE